MSSLTPIGIFDSGYGGLTVMSEIVTKLPQYDYIYLGDNARAPYGPRSFDTVYRYTLQCVKWFFDQGVRWLYLLVILPRQKHCVQFSKMTLLKLIPGKECSA
jgi:glutamate racemase